MRPFLLFNIKIPLYRESLWLGVGAGKVGDTRGGGQKGEGVGSLRGEEFNRGTFPLPWDRSIWRRVKKVDKKCGLPRGESLF
jgi:hypothetical protein